MGRLTWILLAVGCSVPTSPPAEIEDTDRVEQPRVELEEAPPPTDPPTTAEPTGHCVEGGPAGAMAKAARELALAYPEVVTEIDGTVRVVGIHCVEYNGDLHGTDQVACSVEGQNVSACGISNALLAFQRTCMDVFPEDSEIPWPIRSALCAQDHEMGGRAHTMTHRLEIRTRGDALQICGEEVDFDALGHPGDGTQCPLKRP